MKRSVKKIDVICDFCVTSNAHEQCLHCHKDICWECQQTQGIKYNHAVFFQGSRDGFYCTACDTELRFGEGADDDPVHVAYRQIKYLRDEYLNWTNNFNKRAKGAEAELKRLQQEVAA